jgi:phosphoribosyl 1,2-cyclic phosphate phosphodiesterase
MKITILGCGSSGGVPLIGCQCDVCLSSNPRNRRSRASIVIQAEGKTLLVDTSPDLRMQALATGLKHLDAVIYTHAHADHTHGIDDIRSFNFHANRATPCYADADTFNELKQRFSYVFKPPIPEYGWFRPCMEAHLLPEGEHFRASVEGVDCQFFRQHHGSVHSLGIRIGNFAYSTDVKSFPESSLPYLEGLELWIVDCLRYQPVPTHSHLELTLEWIHRFKPKRAILTHMGHEMDYDTLAAQLPKGVEPAYDGMVIQL